MKVWMTTLFLLISTPLFTHDDSQQMVDHAHTHAPKAFQADEKGHLDAYYIQASHLSVKGMELKGFEGASRTKMEAAMAALEVVVNSEEFKEKVINFKNTRGERAFASNKGLSNETIYQMFMDGREVLQPNTPNEMNFYLKLYNKSWSRVVGYTSGNTNVININWKYFKNYEIREVAGNLAHEWTHKLGFGHASAAEHDSAPYAIGYIVEEMAQKVLKGEELI